MPAATISARGLRKSYPGPEGERVAVLQGAELSVGEGELVAVTGPSGCGKSTLLHVLGGLDADFEGEIEVAGHALKGMDDRALARFRSQTVGFVFQSFNLIAPLSALENVLLPSYFWAGDAEVRPRALAALARVGLEGKEKRRPAELSGGERQRVAIARALFSAPKVLLCDEPTGNLDAKTGAEIIELFRGLNAEGLTMLLVTHEERVCRAARRVVRLQQGQVVEGSFA